ncbi:MAG: carbon storage regulator [Planctomycetaceae bacterium]|nr:carbon storage regulator [Planctomycetales bacterium]MCB9873773.1 carbon storage regulator [Planctomycetaceae bacterium]MCB9939736.1 carbon storage regulator [Planctomycetaceae bacterium]HRX77663.1 carbon storage regulator [Pirellulaceae bacterium]
MLVLSRKIGEEIVIAGNVCVRIAGIEGKRVKLSISAPSDIPIFRGEIHRQRCEFSVEPELLALIGD